jgi:hypothetical protein
MYKKGSDKKMLLNRETLRLLSTDHLKAVAGGVTYTCTHLSVCRTNCHSC